jgi:hypothetical protein
LGIHSKAMPPALGIHSKAMPPALGIHSKWCPRRWGSTRKWCPDVGDPLEVMPPALGIRSRTLSGLWAFVSATIYTMNPANLRGGDAKDVETCFIFKLLQVSFFTCQNLTGFCLKILNLKRLRTEIFTMPT